MCLRDRDTQHDTTQHSITWLYIGHASLQPTAAPHNCCCCWCFCFHHSCFCRSPYTLPISVHSSRPPNPQGTQLQCYETNKDWTKQKDAQTSK
ncbi:hypothetical protein E2C01_042864 [Portunus trituberculatus]|uniref:Uncharacterized protein n=1 Tax=Portunus trituberculatus TaxID=210409 RepID=A0A5B7FVT1_PORTR|nr:hypothetical protein [Portunus trituberculatus]